MRIGVDATCFANARGYGRFARELCKALVAGAPGERFTFFADRRAAEAFELSGANVELRVVEQRSSPSRAASADGYRSPRDMLRLSAAVGRAPLDVFFSPSVYAYFPLPPRLRALVTVHDAIAERFPELTLPSRRARLFWKAKVRLALAQARLVLTVSEFAKRDIARVLGVDPARIRVATEAPAAAYAPSDPEAIAGARRRAGLPQGAAWFVYVGGFNPHKHVELLVLAHAAAARRLRAAGRAAPHLLLVGTLSDDVFHADRARIRAAIEAEASGELVHWTGFVADEELRHLHAGALALVLPSACEGFGLPAVEAAACGTPAIATTESPLPELLEGGGLFVRPGDAAALEGALCELALDPARRAALGARALERARALSWERAGAATLAALREVAR